MKYAALMLNALALMLLGWGLFALYGLLTPRVPQARVAMVELAPLPARAATDRQQVADTLDAIARINERMRTLAPVSARPMVAVPALGTPGSVGPTMPRRSVTMVVRQGNEFVAMVDDQLVRQGDRLRNGGKVVKIDSSQVVIREGSGLQTLSMPVDRLRVGTMRSTQAPDATAADRQFDLQTVPGGVR